MESQAGCRPESSSSFATVDVIAGSTLFVTKVPKRQFFWIGDQDDDDLEEQVEQPARKSRFRAIEDR